MNVITSINRGKGQKGVKHAAKKLINGYLATVQALWLEAVAMSNHKKTPKQSTCLRVFANC